MSSSETKSGVGDADITRKKSDDEKEAPRDKLSVTGTTKEIKEVEQMERSTVLLGVGFGYGGCPATVTISEMGSKAAGAEPPIRPSPAARHACAPRDRTTTSARGPTLGGPGRVQAMSGGL